MLNHLDVVFQLFYKFLLLAADQPEQEFQHVSLGAAGKKAVFKLCVGYF